ncbi:acyltransferase family protein [Herbiconiux sp. YIM B11900]|uniref:acyltransferase family protein n=1 Tax=Herbiconiux sp. YIM B11900 TaxID=3404131 RepID=UPI003F8432C5
MTPNHPTAFRADIQGLRAFAVVAVVLAHVTGWPAGGFVGVDVFFVISGFLITGLLLRDAERYGRVSLRRFYATRIRRIAPAAVVVLAITVAVAWFLFNRPRFWETVTDAVSSLLLVVNWRFAAEGTDYFHAGDAVSPLQHFWSLSVEEQFYLVWPGIVLLLVLIALGRGGRGGAGAGGGGGADADAADRAARFRRVRLLVGGALVVIVGASFALAMLQTGSSPILAYYSTLTRGWELGVGALLAVALPVLARMPAALRVLLGWLGLAGVIASFFVISDALPFPAPWAALPVVATALVIAAGAGGPQRHLFPLVNPVSRFFGDISYSLYLWHYPVLVFALMLLPEGNPATVPIILGLGLALASVSYYLVEQPLHRSPWLRGAPEPDAVGEPEAAGEPDATPEPAARRELAREARRDAWQAWRDRFGAQFIFSTIGLVAIVVVVAVTVQLSLRGQGPLALNLPGNGPAAVAAGGDPSPGANAGDGAPADPAPADPAAEVNPEDQLQSELYAAAAASAWPGDLSPSMDSAISEGSSRNAAKDCFAPGSTPDFGRCTWGDGNAPNHLYLVGDSTALAYAPAFKALAEDSGGQWKITTIGLYGCRFTQVLVQNGGDGVMDACPQRKQDIAARIAADSPQLVVVANAFALGKAADGTPLSTNQIVESTLAETAGYGTPGRVVYLAPPPLGVDLGRCYSPVSSPQDCNAGVDQAWLDFEAATTAALAASGTGDHYVSSLGFSCAQGFCPAFAGTTPTKYDTVHLTPEYSQRIAPAIRWELRAQGLF